jgi:hypothetical protein
MTWTTGVLVYDVFVVQLVAALQHISMLDMATTLSVSNPWQGALWVALIPMGPWDPTGTALEAAPPQMPQKVGHVKESAMLLPFVSCTTQQCMLCLCPHSIFSMRSQCALSEVGTVSVCLLCCCVLLVAAVVVVVVFYVGSIKLTEHVHTHTHAHMLINK